MFFGRLSMTCAALAGMAIAHGGAHQKPLQVDPDADWATRHMAEEHHIGNFDPASFFSLHDFDDNGFWDKSEILKLYGMTDPSAKDTPQEKKDEIIREIMKLMDLNNNGIVEKEEWNSFTQERKGTLPDFETGPGHHWDMEMEYEIHHWEKYHDENTKEEDLIHPEDIEHFKLHDEMEDEAERVAQLDKMSIVEQNIPAKFRKDL
ncbi:related to secretory protein SSP120 [Phialocephala subalpina]|uniref:Related to secretory protein SSP120 n=1 Tax=Phialocephala subalpina TaxID=576137 RepID=A0A1L7WGH4_9HELO|nr:related to secretory protein SSP120 [Phialocephala subalpina]